MPEPLSWKIGLGMKVTVLPYFFAVFLVQYLYQSTLSAIFVRVSKRMSISVWPAGGDLVVVDLDLDAHALEVQHHLRAEVLVMVGMGGTGK